MAQDDKTRATQLIDEYSDAGGLNVEALCDRLSRMVMAYPLTVFEVFEVLTARQFSQRDHEWVATSLIGRINEANMMQLAKTEHGRILFERVAYIMNCKDNGGQPVCQYIGLAAARAKKDEESKYCGVNPVLRTPGINAVSSGILGELRPGIGGNGGFKSRTGNKHDAIDIRAPVGTPIYACRDGIVEQITRPPEGMGNRIILKHKDGIYTHYAHLSSFAPGIEVKNPRVKVIEGQLIGYAGRTGNVPTDQLETEDHVHFGVSTIVRPAFQGPEWMNPVKYLNECILTNKK